MFRARNLDSFMVKSSSALELKFVRSESDVEDASLAFSPQFTHQVFGEKEMVVGYRNLKMKLYYTPDTLLTYFGLTYDEKVDPAKFDGIKADNVAKIMAEFLPPSYCTGIDDFLSRASKQAEFRPHGDLLKAYTRESGITYEVYKVDLSCPGFRDYHERLQLFLLWFVDAASFIDVDDDKWTFYLIFKKKVVAGRRLYSIVGYTTVYSFYAYPDKLRPRLSQMLILPPFQRKGHGSELLRAVYDDLVPLSEVIDITVEDPSDEFTALRDFVDCQNAQRLPAFRPPLVHRPYTEAAEVECRKKLKLQKKQGLRVYEILRLQATNRSDREEYRVYRLAVKNRLNGPYQRELRELRKLQKLVAPEELAMTHPQVSHDEHMTQLEQTYKTIEEDYLKILEKLAGTLEP